MPFFWVMEMDNKRTLPEKAFFERPSKQVRTFSFEEYFVPTENWMDDPMVKNPMQFLASMYPKYFGEKGIKYDLLLEHIKAKRTDKESSTNWHNARELFINLFRFEFRPNPEPGRSYRCMENFNLIINNHGPNLMAHGVEDVKGGMHNLLMMCICDCVRVPSSGWGSLVDIGGAPNLSPESHGPYFIIASTYGGNAPDNPSINHIEYILLPFQENIDDLKKQLEAVKKCGMITTQQQEAFEAKLISYEALNTVLDERMQSASASAIEVRI